MAITGTLLVLFIIGHLAGNSSIFLGPGGINAYAKHLHDLPPLVWGTRIVMLLAVFIHILFGIQLTLENSAANPSKYAVSKSLKKNFASETMIWTGVIVFLFVAYHLAQFTVRVTPDVVLGQDPEGRFDVYGMVVTSLRSIGIGVVYLVAMIALGSHLFHGIQSLTQTLGFNTGKCLPCMEKTGRTLAVIFAAGFAAIPLSILLGILTK